MVQSLDEWICALKDSLVQYTGSNRKDQNCLVDSNNLVGGPANYNGLDNWKIVEIEFANPIHSHREDGLEEGRCDLAIGGVVKVNIHPQEKANNSFNVFSNV